MAVVRIAYRVVRRLLKKLPGLLLTLDGTLFQLAGIRLNNNWICSLFYRLVVADATSYYALSLIHI